MLVWMAQWCHLEPGMCACNLVIDLAFSQHPADDPCLLPPLVDRGGNRAHHQPLLTWRQDELRFSTLRCIRFGFPVFNLNRPAINAFQGNVWETEGTWKLDNYARRCCRVSGTYFMYVTYVHTSMVYSDAFSTESRGCDSTK
jgi:hypothetical protein